MIDVDQIQRTADRLERLGLRQSANELRSAIDVGEDERRAPVQDTRHGTTVPCTGIPWGLHEMLWRVYADFGHGEQSAERLAERGGFSRGEIGMLAVGTYGKDLPARGRRLPLLDLYFAARSPAAQRSPRRTGRSDQGS